MSLPRPFLLHEHEKANKLTPGYSGNPKAVDYASTKGAIATFTRSLATQQAKNGIRVNAVAPGIM